jgi:O-antigen ligase
MLCIPFAYWQGGSFAVFTERWIRSVLVFFSIAALVRTLPQLRRVSFVMVCAIGTVSILTLFYGVTNEGRLAIAVGELANSNQLAMVVLMGIPFSLGVLTDSTRNGLIRTAALVIIGLLLVTTLRTGSRTGLMIVGLLSVVVWGMAPAKGKIIGLLAGALGIVLALALLPGELATRYRTLFSSSGAQTMAEREIIQSSDASTESRMQVIREGLRYTLERPIFGLGPGNFVERRNQAYQEAFGHHGYLESHNSYVQVASEMGVPGVAFFIALLVTSYRAATRTYKRYAQAREWSQIQIKNQALGLRLIILVMALFCFFNHIAYDLYIPTIAGLIVALEAVVWNEESRQQRQPAAAPARPAAAWAPVVPPAPVAPVAPRPRLNGSPRDLHRPELPRRGAPAPQQPSAPQR